MSLKKSILKNSLASFSTKISILLIRLLQVPFFIAAFGINDYGHWIVISSLPSWLAISSLGFGSVAANDISMSVASGNIDKANKTFSTTLWLISIIALIGTVIIISFLWIIPLDNIYSGISKDLEQTKFCILFLSLSVFVSFATEVYVGRLRAVNKAYQGILLSNIKPWIEFFGFIITFYFTKRFDVLALVSLSTTLLQVIIISIIGRGSVTNVFFSIKNIHYPYIKPLFRKGIAFQAFPLGNAMLFQGNILVIQFVLGSAGVVLFSTARTLVRSINQVMEMINQIVWPEFSLLFGKKDFLRIRRLHRLSVCISLISAILCILPLSIFGVTIYKIWTGKSIPLDNILLFFFLLPILFNALWYTSSVVHAASNKHEGLAVRYLIACFLSLLACYILSKFYGINGAAISTILSDLIVLPYVIRKSMKLTNDNIKDFINGLYAEAKDFFIKIKSIVIISLKLNN